MIRWGVIVASVFAMGLAAGLLLPGGPAGVAPKASPLTQSTGAAELTSLRSELARLEYDWAMLAARNDAIEAEAAALRSDQTLMDEVLQEATSAEDMPVPLETPAPTAPQANRRRGGPQPTPEQMAEFRNNFEEQQASRQERLTEQLAQMNDPNAIDNFNALMELQQEEQQLRRQMRDAATDDARAKIDAQLRETQAAARQTLNDQQNAMLHSLAASSGINDPGAQQKFIDDLRATLDNPFFRMEPMLLGGGPGRGGPRGMGFGGPWGPGGN